MTTIDLTSKYFIHQQRHELLSALYRLLSVVEYNFIDSNFFDLLNNLENMLDYKQAEQIIDFIGYRTGMEDMYVLIDELQHITHVDLSPQTVLFIMMAPVRFVEDQLNTDPNTSAWLYDKLHLHTINDDLIEFTKELVSEAEDHNVYEGKMLN